MNSSYAPGQVANQSRQMRVPNVYVQGNHGPAGGNGIDHPEPWKWQNRPSLVAVPSSQVIYPLPSGGTVNVTINAGVAGATAAGVSDTPNVIQLPPPAAATAAGVAPIPEVDVLPGVAAASAGARPATPEVDVLTSPATASAAGVAPVPQVSVSPGVAAASASAIAPTLSGLAVSVSVGVAGAVAAAIAPLESTRKTAGKYQDRGWSDRDVWVQPEGYPESGWLG